MHGVKHLDARISADAASGIADWSGDANALYPGLIGYAGFQPFIPVALVVPASFLLSRSPVSCLEPSLLLWG